MRIFGLIIQREKGRVVGSLEGAIVDLQARVNVLEHNQVVKVKEAELRGIEQSEVARILNSGGQSRPAGLWEGL